MEKEGLKLGFSNLRRSGKRAAQLAVLIGWAGGAQGESLFTCSNIEARSMNSEIASVFFLVC